LPFGSARNVQQSEVLPSILLPIGRGLRCRGVVDLLSRRRQAEVLPDDLDDVFARYYQEHPDSDGLEVFDE